MSKMRDTWKKAKDSLGPQLSDLQKKNPQLDLKPLQTALGNFDAAFGPLLDKVADAHKAGKGEDMQRLAKTARASGQQFMGTLEKVPSLKSSGGVAVLRGLLVSLKECEDKGLKVARNIVTLS